jgi:hypothetical protein
LKTFSYPPIEELSEIDEIAELLSSLNVSVVTFEEAAKARYEKLMILPGYLFFASTESFLKNFEYSTLGMFADGLRNDNFYLDYQLPKDKNILEVYFGYFPRLSRSSTTQKEPLKTTFELVELNFIKDIWSRIIEGFPSKRYEDFQPSDLLVVMRRWGKDPYLLRDGVVLADLLKDLVTSEQNINRVIYRGLSQDHNFLEIDITEFRDWLSARGVKFVFWNEILNESTLESIFVNPESLLTTEKIGRLGYLFAFDSTVNLVASLCAKNTKVIVPDSKIFENIFEHRNANIILKDHCKLVNRILVSEEKDFQKIALEYEAGGWPNQVKDKYLEDFQATNMRITEERDGLTAERDGLTAERDGLTAERDGLTAERDGLTAERDALINSTIWKATKPVRRVVAWIKRKD